MEEVLIVSGARTPFGTYGGSLKDVDSTELGVIASKGAIERAGIPVEEIDNAVFGNVIQSSTNSPYIARHIALKAGLPIHSAALTVNRLCGSGLQAVVSAAQSIRLGESHVSLVGGTESMSQAPYMLRNVRFGGGPKMDDMLTAALTDEYCGTGMGVTAENLAKKYQISREEQDQFAYESHMRAAKARESGKLAEEIVPVTVKGRKGQETVVAEDEHIRPDTTLDKLARLKPVFLSDGTVTAGNSSGINDGAAALIVASESYVSRKGLKPLARLVSWAVAGVEPSIMGIGPVAASKIALERAGLTIDDMDLVEINEAFAAQYLSVEKELGLDRNKTNVNGGAIALGHPVGASGARILLTLIYELKRRQAKRGLASLCIGGGQGITAIVEML
ncbi:MAG: beta-ketoadipyl CoA thiolase [Bacillus thermozeamaize]|jgi:acetyl-CoA C-acetyltransferase|uniref:acetyl-CoA C-acetyltransferase n=1 Tax=Bacillus thermozeamaize TaxID=230954 RepID=A0A1Y3PSZ6_9BACI|nr:MAG: beta-ketoadipyl CoA thiolase [Bacillus thermozeamaize]